MNPFEALALLRMVGGHYTVWWRRAPLLGRGFLLICSWIRRKGGPVDPIYGFGASTRFNCYCSLQVIKVNYHDVIEAKYQQVCR